MVAAACVDPDGNLVVGTHNGQKIFGWMARAIGDMWSSATNLRKILYFRCISTNQGNLWAGTDGGGLYRVRKNNFQPPTTLPPGVAKSIAEDSAGGIWVAYNAHGLAYSLSNSVHAFDIGKGNNAWTVMVDRQQKVWAGTHNDAGNTGDAYLFHLEDGVFKPVYEAQKIGLIFTLFQSHDGKLWVGGQNGLANYDGQSWKFFSSSEGLPPGTVRAVAEDANSDLWIGMDNLGIFLLHDGKISPVNAPTLDVTCLMPGRDGVLWAGTAGHGLMRLARGQWTTYASADGLTVDDIGYLIEDDYTNLWLGSYERLMRADEKSLADFAAHAVKKVSCRTFFHRGNAPLGLRPAAIYGGARRPKLWFPTIEGVVSVNPADLRPNTNPPPVVIESVLVDGVRQENSLLEFNLAAGHRDASGKRAVGDSFHGVELFPLPKGAQLAVRFRDQLDEEETRKRRRLAASGWHISARLSPGNYVFHVTACNEDGFWNDTGASMTIIVEPPFCCAQGLLSTPVF